MGLQTPVLIFVCTSWLMWFSATCLYIPYVLWLAPTVVVHEDTGDVAPGEDMGSGKAAAIVIVCALFCDSLLLAGVYQKYQGGRTFRCSREYDKRVFCIRKSVLDIFLPMFTK